MIPVRKIAISEITTPRWNLREDVEAYARTPGVEGIGVWRNKLADVGVAAAAKQIRDAGLGVSSLIFAGRFTDPGKLAARLDDTRRAIDEAHQLGARAILTLAGPRLGIDVAEGNRRVRAALEALAPEAVQAGVTLALEPIHPMHAAEVSTIVTLDQALDVIAGIPGTGILYDTWNTWWDPQVGAAIDRARGQIAAVQLADWRRPDGDPRDRAVPGEGVAPLTDLIARVERAGYSGWYEVEVITSRYAPAQYPELLEACVRGTQCVFPVPEQAS